MRIGILQTGQAPDVLRPTFGDYPEMFADLLAGNDFQYQPYLVEKMEFPASIDECDGWLITGSRHAVYEDHAFIDPLESFVRHAIEGSKPVVGICFGHQLIAQALGGKVQRYAGGWAIGQQAYDFGDQTLKVNAWHRDQVVVRPERAKRLASNSFCENAALSYGRFALTFQPHPEFRDGYVDGLMETRGKGIVPEDLITQARAKMGLGDDSASFAKMIGQFFNACGRA